MLRNIIRCTFIIGIWRYLCTLIGKLLCFINKRKLSTSTCKIDESSLLTSIKVQGDNYSNETNIVDWDNWEEGGENKDDNNPNGNADGFEAELFKDMEPVIDKAKVIHVKKTIRAPKVESPLLMGYSNGHLNHSTNSLNQKYQVESELGSMEDGADDGWGEEIDDNFISQETETMIQKNKLIEREKRLMEQKQKKLERDMLRAQKRHDSSYIGVKIK